MIIHLKLTYTYKDNTNTETIFQQSFIELLSFLLCKLANFLFQLALLFAFASEQLWQFFLLQLFGQWMRCAYLLACLSALTTIRFRLVNSFKRAGERLATWPPKLKTFGSLQVSPMRIIIIINSLVRLLARSLVASLFQQTTTTIATKTRTSCNNDLQDCNETTVLSDLVSVVVLVCSGSFVCFCANTHTHSNLRQLGSFAGFARPVVVVVLFVSWFVCAGKRGKLPAETT